MVNIVCGCSDKRTYRTLENTNTIAHFTNQGNVCPMAKHVLVVEKYVEAQSGVQNKIGNK